MARSGVVLHFSVAPMVEKLSDADAGAVFKSVFDYAANGVVPDFSERPMADLVWAGLRPLIDRDAEHYSQKCESSSYSAYCREQQRAGLEPLPREVWNIERHRTMSNDTNTIQDKTNKNQDNTIQNKSNTKQHNAGSEAAAPLSALPPPSSVDEVKAFASRENLPDDAEKFYNYYAGLGWKHGRTAIADWQCFYRKWVANEWSATKSAAPAAAPPENIDWDKERQHMASVYAVLSGERDT